MVRADLAADLVQFCGMFIARLMSDSRPELTRGTWYDFDISHQLEHRVKGVETWAKRLTNY
jgi:hypothetical protein